MTTRGSGFDAEDHDIRLNIYSPNQDPLKTDKDYLITKDVDGDGIILKLLGNVVENEKISYSVQDLLHKNFNTGTTRLVKALMLSLI